MRALALLLLLVACSKSEPSPQIYLNARAAEIMQHARAAGPGQVLLIGDSITVLQTLTSACGLAVVNGGIGGADPSSYLTVVDEILSVARPKVVTVLIGGSDLRPPVTAASIAKSQANYATLLDRIAQSGAQTALLTYPPIERSAVGQFDLGAGYGQHKFTMDIGASRGFPVVDVHVALAGPDGWMPPGGTLDGVHTKPKLLEPFVKDAIREGLAQSGRSCAP